MIPKLPGTDGSAKQVTHLQQQRSGMVDCALILRQHNLDIFS